MEHTLVSFLAVFHVSPLKRSAAAFGDDGSPVAAAGGPAVNPSWSSADQLARIDGGTEGTYMGYAEERHYNQLLFSTGGLADDKEHVLVSRLFLSLCMYGGCGPGASTGQIRRRATREPD